MDFPRFNELFDLAVERMLEGNPALTEEVIRQEGTDANALAAAMAAVGEEVVRQVAIVARDRTLSTARGDALDRLAYDLFGLVRNDAATALVTLSFSRPDGEMPVGTIPGGTRCAVAGGGGAGAGAGAGAGTAATGMEFATIEDLPVPLGSPGGTVQARAVQTGPAGNAAAGTITRIKSQIGFDSTFTVTNPAPAAGGSDRETDDAFRARCRSFWSAARRGTLGAIEFGALEEDGVATARATETPLPGPEGGTVGKWVTLAVADGAGTANADLAAAVEARMDEWRPCGVYVQVLAAATQYVDVEVALTLKAGCDTVAAVRRLRRGIVALVNGLRVGEKLSRGAIHDLVRKDPDVVVNSVNVVKPTVDIVPASASTVARTSEERVKLTSGGA